MAEGSAIPSTRKIESRAASISSKKKAAQKIQRKNSYLKARCKELEENMSASEEADEHQDNAGYQFGGRKGKNHQKRSDLLIGRLLLHWVEVVNYLVNCLFITPRITTGNNSVLRSIARIHSTASCNIYVFQSGKRKVLTQGWGSVVYRTMDLDSHADTIV